MKKNKIYLLAIILILAFSTVASSQTIHKQAVSMKWEQPIFLTLQGWKFYASKTSGTGFTEIYSKTYSPSEGTVGAVNPLYPEMENKTFVQVIDIPDSAVTKGQLQRIYFRSKAIRTDGQEGEWSNEGYIDLDLRPMPVPKIICEAVK